MSLERPSSQPLSRRQIMLGCLMTVVAFLLWRAWWDEMWRGFSFALEFLLPGPGDQSP